MRTLPLAALAVVSVLQLLSLADAQCVISQHCKRTKDQPMNTTFCPDSSPAGILNPLIDNHPPEMLYRPELLNVPCPYIDGTKPVCCNDD